MVTGRWARTREIRWINGRMIARTIPERSAPVVVSVVAAVRDGETAPAAARAAAVAVAAVGAGKTADPGCPQESHIQ
jgi:hypothetical protein